MTTTSYGTYCKKHDLEHPDEPVCPMCKLETRLEDAERVIEAAVTLSNNLSNDEIELAREVWGNTNTGIVLRAKQEFLEKYLSYKKGQS